MIENWDAAKRVASLFCGYWGKSCSKSMIFQTS
jgi:hypothetical protein